jgi:hypothetical protein
MSDMRNEGEDERCWDWLRKRERDEFLRKNGGFEWKRCLGEFYVKDVLGYDKD